MTLKASTVWKRFAVSPEGRPWPSFSALQFGAHPNKDSSHILLATSTGSIQFIPLFEPYTYETPLTINFTGSSIFCLELSNQIQSKYREILIGDSDGNIITVEAAVRQSQRNIYHPVSCATFDSDMGGKRLIIVGDRDGQVTAISSISDNEYEWKIRLPSPPIHSSLSFPVDFLLPCTLKDNNGLDCHFVVATNGGYSLHFIASGSISFDIKLPSTILSICCGKFSSSQSFQIAAACEDGNIYMVDNFTVQLWCESGFEFTKLAAYSSSHASYDTLLCAGRVNALFGYNQGKQVLQHECSQWITCLRASPLENNGKLSPNPFVLIGLADGSIEVMALQ